MDYKEYREVVNRHIVPLMHLKISQINLLKTGQILLSFWSPRIPLYTCITFFFTHTSVLDTCAISISSLL